MIYLDHAATTPLDPRVQVAMEAVLREAWGNPSSLHALGRAARFRLEDARERVAACLGAEPAEIIFTSGGTEADNLALRGVVGATGGGLATSPLEHEAVLRTAHALSEAGHAVGWVAPDAWGRTEPAALEEALGVETGPGAHGPALVSLMHANNEVGTLNDVAALAAVCRAHGALLHTDAVQTAGLLPLRVDALGADLLTLSGHKCYGPKGAGVLYARGGAPLRSALTGGAQERGRRGGTENVAAAVGLAVALELAQAEAPEAALRLAALRDYLRAALEAALGEGSFRCNTPPGAAAAPHVLSIAFPPDERGPLDGEMLLLGLDLEGVCVSAGSACTSGALTPSHVLLGLGLPRETAAAALRFSLGRASTRADLDAAVEALARVLRRMGRPAPGAGG